MIVFIYDINDDNKFSEILYMWDMGRVRCSFYFYFMKVERYSECFRDLKKERMFRIICL